MASQLAAKERRLQQLQRAVTDLQGRLVAALERNALACARKTHVKVPQGSVSIAVSVCRRSKSICMDDGRRRTFQAERTSRVEECIELISIRLAT